MWFRIGLDDDPGLGSDIIASIEGDMAGQDIRFDDEDPDATAGTMRRHGRRCMTVLPAGRNRQI